MRPRHRLGQNFLVDPALRDSVVAAARLDSRDLVLEVGAGAGALTVRLAELVKQVVAVELDERLVALLMSLTARQPAVGVVQGDILRTDPGRWFPDGGEVVVGNIPYYLSGALLRHLLDEPPRPRRLSLVVQKEVADRWLGSSGSSLATVVVHTLTEPHVELELPRTAFMPIPEVDSALVVMEVRGEAAVHVDSLDSFFRVVERLFQFRRKQLRASVARVLGISSAEAERRLEVLGVEPSRRPEELRLEDWETLYRGLGASLLTIPERAARQ